MFTKTVIYKDFDGNERTEVCRFNLSEPEIIEMESSYPGGLEQMLKRSLKRKISRKFLQYSKNSYSSLMVKKPQMEKGLLSLKNYQRHSHRLELMNSCTCGF